MPNATSFGAADLQRETGANPVVMARLQRYAETLLEWSTRMNLVSAASLPDLWHRHVFDSAQLVPMIPATATRLLDFGSGAGLPALILAALLAERPGLHVTMVESIEKKCAFLRAAAAAMAVEPIVTVHRGRVEDLKGGQADVITARAVAPLDTLLHYAQQFTGKSTLCLFPKGRTAADELTQARRSWRIDAELIPSRSDPEGSVVAVRSFSFKGRRP